LGWSITPVCSISTVQNSSEDIGSPPIKAAQRGSRTIKTRPPTSKPVPAQAVTIAAARQSGTFAGKPHHTPARLSVTRKAGAAKPYAPMRPFPVFMDNHQFTAADLKIVCSHAALVRVMQINAVLRADNSFAPIRGDLRGHGNNANLFPLDASRPRSTFCHPQKWTDV
jgi:hypothetical protein